MNKAVTVRRLGWLKETLLKVPDKRLYMGYWVSSSWGGRPDLSCGTSACAMGWATTNPKLRHAGLRLHENVGPEYKGLMGFDAAQAVFGLTHAEAMRLFDPAKYNTVGFLDCTNIKPHHVISRIDKVIAEYLK